MKIDIKSSVIVFLVFFLIGRCTREGENTERMVPKEEKWGIYYLDLETQDVTLVYSSKKKISGLDIDQSGETFVFSQRIDGDEEEHEEICILKKDGTNFQRLTNNSYFDTYPSWSSNGDKIAFCSRRDENLDIYVMDKNGGNQQKIYDSGGNDGDVNWQGNFMVFTRNSQVWIMKDDGTEARQVTDPPRAGEWGNTNLPFGDYDPKLSPEGDRIVFERLVDDKSVHGNYDIYLINSDGTGEVSLTQNGYTQGLPHWSPDGQWIVYLVTAINGEGKYDLYMVKSDGSENKNITPDYFPPDFLCHSPVFSPDGDGVYFVGEWWE